MRHDGRQPDQLRPLEFRRGYTRQAPGSVLVQSGRTTVLCTCCVENVVPPFLVGSGKGWLTAEYGMLPGSTNTRKPRDKAGKVDGRTVEIQRLIGRSLRAIVNLENLGERTLWIDCDVLEADGGTRTASITGAFIALVDAIHSLKGFPDANRHPLRDSLAAISVGIVDGHPALDLDYVEDFAAGVDMNVVMTGSGQFIEVQGTGEKTTFSEQELTSLIKHARGGIRKLTEIQRKALGKDWPF